MYLLSRFHVCALLLAPAAPLVAQDDIPADRGGRGNTREFLGLGPAPDAAASGGEKLYAPNCAFCHGEKARGAAGPNLVRRAASYGTHVGTIVSNGASTYMLNGSQYLPAGAGDTLFAFKLVKGGN
jgi:mono/diheme cytochrome c family protein